MTVSVLAGLALVLLPVAVAGGRIDLPRDLAGYRTWPQLLKVPYEVPLELWIRCVAPTAADWAAARERYGPHTKRFIRVYGNGLAEHAFAATGDSRFPVGAVVVKEKLAGDPRGSPDGIAFMVKRSDSTFASTGGWEFLYFPASGDKRRTHESCASCHQAASGRDYVFGAYPR